MLHPLTHRGFMTQQLEYHNLQPGPWTFRSLTRLVVISCSAPGRYVMLYTWHMCIYVYITEPSWSIYRCCAVLFHVTDLETFMWSARPSNILPGFVGVPTWKSWLVLVLQMVGWSFITNDVVSVILASQSKKDSNINIRWVWINTKYRQHLVNQDPGRGFPLCPTDHRWLVGESNISTNRHQDISSIQYTVYSIYNINISTSSIQYI